MEINKSSLESELTNWWEQEKKLAAVFPPALLQSADFQKEKLKHFRLLSSKFAGVQDSAEKLLLKVLNLEIKRLQRMLFPNWFGRMIWILFMPIVPANSLLEKKDDPEINSRLVEETKPSLEPGMKELTAMSDNLQKDKAPDLKVAKNIADLLPKKAANHQKGLNVK